MPLGTVDLAKARDAVTELLEELKLDAYLFAVEPRNGRWEVKVECAVENGWETVTFAVAKDSLLASLNDWSIRHRLLDEWRVKLAACKVYTPQT